MYTSIISASFRTFSSSGSRSSSAAATTVAITVLFASTATPWTTFLFWLLFAVTLLGLLALVSFRWRRFRSKTKNMFDTECSSMWIKLTIALPRPGVLFDNFHNIVIVVMRRFDIPVNSYADLFKRRWPRWLHGLSRMLITLGYNDCFGITYGRNTRTSCRWHSCKKNVSYDFIGFIFSSD